MLQELEVYFQVEKTYRKMRQGLIQTLQQAEAPITLDQWMVLKMVKEHQGISQINLADALNKEAPSVTRMVDVLMRLALIEREVNREDRRKYHLVLTEKGEEVESLLSPGLIAYMQEALERAFKDTTPDKRGFWEQQFEKINRQL